MIEIAPRPNRVRAGLAGLYRPLTRHYVGAVSAYYAVITAAHLVMLSGTAAIGMAAISAATAGLGAMLLLRLLDSEATLREQAIAAFVIGVAAIANVTIHGVALRDPGQLDYLAVMAIGFAFVGPTVRVVWTLLAAVAAAFIAIAMATQPPTLAHSLFVIGVALSSAAYAAPWAHGQLRRHVSSSMRAERLAARVSAEQARNDALVAAAAAAAANQHSNLGLILRYAPALKTLAREAGGHAGARLSAQLDALACLAALDISAPPPPAQTTNLAEAVSSALAAARPALSERTNTLTAAIEPDLGEAALDGQALSQAVTALLLAAAETTRSGIITVRALRQAAGLVIDVTDTGDAGPSEAAALFLAQAQALAQRLGGDLQIIASQSFGRKATLRVPLAAPAARAA